MTSLNLGDPVALDYFKLAAQKTLSPVMAHSLELSTHVEREFDRMTLQVKTMALGKRLPSVSKSDWTWVYFEQPASWWDHWKRAHPRLRRFFRLEPPAYERVQKTAELTVTVDRAALFPECDYLPSGPRLGAPVLIWQEPRATWSTQ